MANSSICSTSPTDSVTANRAAYLSLFTSLISSGGAVLSPTCTVAVAADSASYCGFSTLSDGQNYCNNNYDFCCTLNGLTQVKSAPATSTTTTAASSSSSSTGISVTGIEIGAGVLGFILISVVIMVCVVKRKRQRQEEAAMQDKVDMPLGRATSFNSGREYESNAGQVHTKFNFLPSLSNSLGQQYGQYQQQYKDYAGSTYSGQTQRSKQQYVDPRVMPVSSGSGNRDSFYKNIVPASGTAAPMPNVGLAPQFAKQEKKYWAILNFRAFNNDEMPLSIGDIVIIKEFYDDGWCFGNKVGSGVSGYFPKECVAEAPGMKSADPTKANFNKRVSSVFGNEVVSNNATPIPPPSGYFVKFDYYPTMSDELPLRSGDRVFVYEEYDDGWAFGTNAQTRAEGLFPLDILVNFVSNKFNSSNRLNRASSLTSGIKKNATVLIGNKPPAADKKKNPDAFEVIYDFNPAQGDELALRIGDLVVVKHRYDDGSNDGLFPLDCLSMEVNTPRKQRASSMYGSQDNSSSNIFGAYAGSNESPKKDGSEKVVYDFAPERSDEIELRVGQDVIVTKKFDDGWGYGRNITTGSKGNFPLDCLASYNDSNPSTSGIHKPKQRVSSIYEAETQNTNESLGSSNGTETVVYDFDPERSDELTLRVGDKVIVSQKFDDGWGFGVSLATGESGTFPLDCLGSFANNTMKLARSSSIYGNNDSIVVENKPTPSPQIPKPLSPAGPKVKPPPPTADKVVLEFFPERPDEIVLNVGDAIVVDNKYDDGWCYGKNLTTNKEGHFPLDCLASFTGPNSVQQGPAAIKPQRMSSIYGSEYDGDSQPVNETAKVGPDEVVFAFQPENSDEIALRVGDKVMVQKGYDDGWCFGQVLPNGKTGYFPYDCLKSYPVKGNTGTLKKQRVSSVYDTIEADRATSPRSAGKAPRVAIYMFNPANPDEIALRIGDKVSVVQEYDDGWAQGVNISTGSEGLFPLDCLVAAPTTTPPPAAQRLSSIYSTVSGAYAFQQQSPAPQKAKSPSGDVRVAIYDFSPERPDELELHVSDQVVITQSFDDGWSYGRNLTTGREGNFPTDCVVMAGGDAGNGQQRGSSMYGQPSDYGNSLYGEPSEYMLSKAGGNVGYNSMR
ncbi:Sorbin and SH3 domain-containing protein 2 [Entophlyctis luteolus]|nr:Sorbin and SH3 domain-containing protein 2 [Entophlyctis luteolus]